VSDGVCIITMPDDDIDVSKPRASRFSVRSGLSWLRRRAVAGTRKLVRGFVYSVVRSAAVATSILRSAPTLQRMSSNLQERKFDYICHSQLNTVAVDSML